jgi:hypothetical protein
MLPEATEHQTTDTAAPSGACPLIADIVAKVGERHLGRNNRIGTNNFLNQHCAQVGSVPCANAPGYPGVKYRMETTGRNAPKLTSSQFDPTRTFIELAQYCPARRLA